MIIPPSNRQHLYYRLPQRAAQLHERHRVRVPRLQIRGVLRLPDVVTTPGAVLHERKIRRAQEQMGVTALGGRERREAIPGRAEGHEVDRACALHPPRHLLRICC